MPTISADEFRTATAGFHHLPRPKLLKLLALCEDGGYPTVFDLCQDAMADSVNPGICTNPSCGFIEPEVEPDQDRGYCEECDSHTVKSVLILAGLV